MLTSWHSSLTSWRHLYTSWRFIKLVGVKLKYNPLVIMKFTVIVNNQTYIIENCTNKPIQLLRKIIRQLVRNNQENGRDIYIINTPIQIIQTEFIGKKKVEKEINYIYSIIPKTEFDKPLKKYFDFPYRIEIFKLLCKL